ncbi:MAG: 30S ribosomal protein S9 [Vampirovibrio sp.]|nr:30S ribosomal protein S9 [Vampirovibrio sp.]
MSATKQESKKYPQVGHRGTGRRKQAIARVRIKPGTGKIFINGRTFEDYIGNRPSLRVPILQPLTAANVKDQYDILVNTHGGGISGQADAIKLGIARALTAISSDYEQTMRAEGYMTRDPRVKERKKYGLHGARKRPQFSKR